MLQCKDWVQRVTDMGDIDCAVVAVGNKADLADAREVSTEEARAHFEAMNLPLPYFETSAKTGEGVDELFDTVVEMVLDESFTLCNNDNATTEEKAPKATTVPKAVPQRRAEGYGCIIC